MIFSEEELLTALNNPNQHYYYKLTPEDPNFQPIIDYLTGQTQSLPLIQPSPNLGHLMSLGNLLDGNLDSPRSQRLTELFLNPTVYPSVGAVFFSRQIKLLATVNTDAYLTHLLDTAKKANYPLHHLFSSIVDYINEHRNKTFSDDVIITTVAYRWVVASLKATPKFLNLVGHRNYALRWNAFYFTLLEDVRPDLVQDYIRIEDHASSEKIPFLLAYKDGAYMPVYFAMLHDPAMADHEVRNGFYRMAEVYNQSGTRYLPELAACAERFLAVNRRQYSPKAYANWSQIKELNGRFENAAAALHILFQQDQSKATVFLQEWLGDKVALPVDTIIIAFHHLGQAAIPFFKKALTPDLSDAQYVERLLSLVDNMEPADYLTELWALTGSKSKPVRALVARILADKDAAVEEKALALLEHKKTDIRNTAAQILSRLDTPRVRAAMKDALDRETNDPSRDLLLVSMTPTLPATMDIAGVNAMIASARKRDKLKKPIEAFLDESNLPGLYYTDGQQLDAEAIRFFLYRMSRGEPLKTDIEAAYMLALLDKSRSGPFASALLKVYIDSGAAPDQKYLLVTAAALSGEEGVDALRLLVDKWVEAGRYKMAEYGITALTIQGSNKAMRWVEWYSRKYSTKKANIGAAALTALEAAAEQQGITLHELGDQLVPDFGFDGLFKPFQAGGEEYRAFIDGRFKLTFFNEDNKKITTVPATATGQQKQEFKLIAKEVREVVKSQSSRLEYYLVIQRKWTAGQWRQLFLSNPVMFIYATRLLWGIYEGEDEQPPKKTFLCDEDTTLLDANDDELSVESQQYIGIVHPIHLDASVLKNWQEKFFDRGITAIFPQLDRPRADLSDVDVSTTILRKFEGRQTKIGAIRSTLENKGWQKGSTGDGGLIESFNILHRARNLEAILEVEGVSVAYGFSAEERLGKLFVLDRSKLGKGNGYLLNVKEDDEQLAPLNALPPIFLNEIVAAIGSIRREGSE